MKSIYLFIYLLQFILNKIAFSKDKTLRPDILIVNKLNYEWYTNKKN